MDRKRKSWKFPWLLVILILSLCLNLFLILSPGGLTEQQQDVDWRTIKEINKPGTYGPSGRELVEGNLTICTGGVTLQNTLVRGDLLLDAAIGDGSVNLAGIEVEGTTLVEGGGAGTVVIKDAALQQLVINREEGRVRVVLTGNTSVEKIVIQGEASLFLEDLADKKLVQEVYIETTAETELKGDFSSVKVAQKEARVVFLAGEIENLITLSGAEEASITLQDGVVVNALVPGASLTLEGQGLVKEVSLKAPGLFQFSGNLEKITAGGSGIFLQLDSGLIDTLLVEDSGGKVMVHLAQETKIDYLELNGPAGITGKGSIGRALIKAAGTTIEQSPGQVELAEGVTAKIAGEEVTGEKKPETPSTPSTPTVSLTAIGNQLLRPGHSKTFNLTVSPGDAAISVKSSNSSVAQVSLSGKQLKITAGSSQGSATITVTASKPGYNSRTRTFTVTVDPIVEFIVKKHDFSPGKEVVIVKLSYPDPQNYNVTVGGTTLKYMSDMKAFYGEFLEGSVSRSSVRVTRE